MAGRISSMHTWQAMYDTYTIYIYICQLWRCYRSQSSSLYHEYRSGLVCVLPSQQFSILCFGKSINFKMAECLFDKRHKKFTVEFFIWWLHQLKGDFHAKCKPLKIGISRCNAKLFNPCLLGNAYNTADDDDFRRIVPRREMHIIHIRGESTKKTVSVVVGTDAM